jgi:hypothetical protein
MPTLYAYVDPHFYGEAETKEVVNGRTLPVATFLRMYGTPTLCTNKKDTKGYVELTSGMYVWINWKYHEDYTTLIQGNKNATVERSSQEHPEEPPSDSVQMSATSSEPSTPEAEADVPVRSQKSHLHGAVEAFRTWFSNLSFGSRT